MKSNLWNILKKELRELFRDKKSLSMMLVIPIFIPLLVIGMSALFESQVNVDTNEYNKIGFSYSLSDVESKLAKEMDIDVTTGEEKELKEQYEEGNIDLYITKKDNHYTIHSDGSDSSSYASTLMETYFNSYKEILQQQTLLQNNIDADKVLNVITVEEEVLEEDNFYDISFQSMQEFMYIHFFRRLICYSIFITINICIFIYSNGNYGICNISCNRYNGWRKRTWNVRDTTYFPN